LSPLYSLHTMSTSTSTPIKPAGSQSLPTSPSATPPPATAVPVKEVSSEKKKRKRKQKKEKVGSLTQSIIDGAAQWQLKIGRPGRRSSLEEHDGTEERKKMMTGCNDLQKSMRAVELTTAVTSCVEAATVRACCPPHETVRSHYAITLW
jgi:hypothetical protein